jgi:hypothetical protein
MRKSIASRRAATILFSVTMAVIMGFLGLLAGSLLWARFGSPEADEMTSERVGVLGFLVLAILGGCGSLWKFWPRAEGGGIERRPARVEERPRN